MELPKEFKAIDANPAHVTVFIDTETGGLEHWPHEWNGGIIPMKPIIQIGAVAVDTLSGDFLDEIEIKVAFNYEEADPEALAMNSYAGNSWQWEAAGVEAGRALRILNGWLERFRGVRRVSRSGNTWRAVRMGGHNAQFDYRFLDAAMKRHGLFNPIDYHLTDTIAWAQVFAHVSGEILASYKLADLAAFFGIETGEAHDALSDAKTAARLWLFLANEFDRPRAVSQCQ